jgi:hypothetical protein
MQIFHVLIHYKFDLAVLHVGNIFSILRYFIVHMKLIVNSVEMIYLL